MQAPGRVDDDHVAAAGDGGFHPVVRDGGRVRAALGAHEVSSGPLRPDLELLLGRRAVSVGRSDDDRAAVLRQPRRELPDRRGLAGAVDADDEDHGRLVGEVEHRRLAKQLRRLLREGRVQVRELPARLEPPHELGGCAHADVAGDQRLLEPLPVGVVARVERRCGGELAGERPARLRERVAQPREEAAAALLLGRRRRVRFAQQLSPAPHPGSVGQTCGLAYGEAELRRRESAVSRPEFLQLASECAALASCHSSLRISGTSLPSANTASTSSSGPPTMKSMWMLQTFVAGSGSPSNAYGRPIP